MSSGRFLGGLLIGGALGAIIGMLMAPRSGEETREMIREEIADRANRSVEGARSRAVELRDRAKMTAEELQERGQQIAGELEEAGREAWGKVRSTVKAGKNGVEEPLS